MVDFEAHREHLRAVAFRMLGSASDADDAVQETWLRVERADTAAIRSDRAWLTTVVARVCLDMLRSRSSRREVPLDRPVAAEVPDPEQEAVLAESVGLALMVVLDRLSPPERLALVLHDMFGVPFKEIAPILRRSVPAVKMLASRARGRVRAVEEPEGDLDGRRRVVEEFLSAARNGDLAALLDVLDPDVIARADPAAAPPGMPPYVRGAEDVARQALAFSRRAEHARVGLADGAPAVLVEPHGRLAVVLTFVIDGGTIAALEIVADPDRLGRLAVER